MARRRKQTTDGGFPSREEIAAFVRERGGRVDKREIARAFGLGAGERHALNRVLEELENTGAIQRTGKRNVAHAGGLPAVGVVEVTDIDDDGEAIARPVSWRGAGPEPVVRIVPERGRGSASAIGDRILARLKKVHPGLYTAQPMKRLEARPRTVVGVYRDQGSDGGRVEPTDKRLKTEFLVAPEDRGGAEDGELVVCETISPARHLGVPGGRISERVGHIDAPRAASLIAIHTHGIPVEFSRAALAHAETARPVPMTGRDDLREVPLVTIDGADARDFDDAVWAEPDEDPGNPGGWHIIVAVADVAWYVRPDDALDSAAYERGNSVYFADRVIPMLPEALSNGLCSLRPGEDRACLAVDIWIDAEGRKHRHRFRRAMMRSAARLTYDEVQSARETASLPAEGLPPGLLNSLYGAFAALYRQREARGTIDLDLPERRAVMDDDGRILRIETRARYDSHRLIEEFMICANVCAAETLESLRQPCMYRVHDEPARDRVAALRQYLASLGFSLGGGQAVRPRHFAQLLRRVAETPHVHAINEAILRSQSQAVYSPVNLGHFGLALRRYAHFTSPIRRYSDLLVHRALISGLRLGAGGLGRRTGEYFEEMGEHISMTERRAMMAERDAMDRLVAAYMEQHVGAELDGRISGVERFGLFVRLEETGADGLLPASALGPERFRFDSARRTLAGPRGLVYRLGDPIRVRLAEAAPVTGGLVFTLAEHAESLPAPRHARGKAGKPAGRRTQRGSRR